jgi:hypothetical protein
MQEKAELRLDSNARMHIVHLISQGRYQDPVASLYDEGPSATATGDVARVIRNAALGSKVDEPIARDFLAKTLSSSQIDWRLQVGIHEKNECVGVELVTLSGFTFAMAFDIQVALANYTLVLKEQRLLLVGPGDVATSLGSVKTLSLW